MRHDSGMNKLTPNLVVERIETSLAFWVDRLGFVKKVEVPDGDRLGFVILEHGAVELMLQSRASFEKDVPALAAGPQHATLYFEVADLAPIRKALEGYARAVPDRKTFYGAKEIIVRDPDGHAVFFGQHG
jgi:uncharacterized glyoxalase superfamily protein PhnB